MELPHPSTWVLHLKNTTPLNVEAVFNLPTSTSQSQCFLEKVWRYMDPTMFENLYTSKTIKPTQLPMEDIRRAVEMNKFEPCPGLAPGRSLPEGCHGVNVFAVPELKGRRRLITEPHLNAVIAKHEIPKVYYPTRLARRQSLRYAKYMLQIDFEAFYDSVPIPEELRNNFVFRAKDGSYYRLRTLPTGARWSVAVGQAITSTVVDVDTPIVIHTLIDNIMIAAAEGQEGEFLRVVRTILHRIRRVNLLTSPDREGLLGTSDHNLLSMAQGGNVFLGEEYSPWNGTERLVRNSVKTVAKLRLALRIDSHTHRSFASLVSLIMFALHTTQLNPARVFTLLRAYRGVYRQVARGFDWDEPMQYLDEKVKQVLHTVGSNLCENPWWGIAEERYPSYRDSDYDVVCFTDASASGWGAVVTWVTPNVTKTFQQRWTHDLLPIGQRSSQSPHQQFNARRSAHAEPRGAQVLLRELVKHGLPNGSRVALVTDHFPIVLAQRGLNGYGGIGRGYALNRLFEYTYDLLFERNIQVTFFYLAGECNPADELSRNFGGVSGDRCIVSADGNGMGLPPLSCAFSPLCPEVV